MLRRLWALLRVALALVTLGLCLRAFPALHAWADFERLPAHDFAAEAALLVEQRDWPAVVEVTEAGLALAPPTQHGLLLRMRDEAEAQLAAPGYRVAEFGRGALTGRGGSTEAMVGAVVADLLVFGDVRDLTLEGGKALRGEAVDEVLVVLSTAGLALTVLPVADAGVALLKAARRAGAMSARLARSITRLGRQAARGDVKPLRGVVTDAGKLAGATRPTTAMRILGHVDDVDELAAAARLAVVPGGGYALGRSGKAGLRWLRSGAPADAVVLRAAGKGPAGVARLAGRGAGYLLRPHPLLGLVKGVYKGHIPQLAERLLSRWGDMLLPLAGLWLLIELWRLRRAWRRPAAGGGRQRIEPVVG